jgi:hypothetical protein
MRPCRNDCDAPRSRPRSAAEITGVQINIPTVNKVRAAQRDRIPCVNTLLSAGSATRAVWRCVDYCTSAANLFPAANIFLNSGSLLDP